MSRSEQFERMYMNIAYEVAQLSRCNRKKVGAIIVKDGNIVSFGYNGTPSGFCNECEENDVTKDEGAFEMPDSIDRHNDEVARLFLGQA